MILAPEGLIGALWQEVLDADTYARGKGSTVARVIEGKVWPQKLTGMAGVSNSVTAASI